MILLKQGVDWIFSSDTFIVEFHFLAQKNGPYPKLSKYDNSDVHINNKRRRILFSQFISHQNAFALPYIFGRFVLIFQFQGCYCRVVRGDHSLLK